MRCGKADGARAVLFRAEATADPINIGKLSRPQKIAFQRQAQMVFQDPYSSLSPRMRVQEALTEPMEIHRIGTKLVRRD